MVSVVFNQKPVTVLRVNLSANIALIQKGSSKRNTMWVDMKHLTAK